MKEKKYIRKTAAVILAAFFAVAAVFTVTPINSYAAAKPAKVTGVNAAARSNYSVMISWKKAKGARKYQIYRANAKNGSYKRTATLTGTSFIDSNLKKGTKYFYKVRAVSGNSKGDFSIKKSIATKKSKLYDVKVDESAKTVTINARLNGRYFSKSTRHLMVDQYGFNKGTAVLSSYCIPDDLYNGLVRAGGVSWSKSAGKKLNTGEKNTVKNAENKNFSRMDITIGWDNESHSLNECLTTVKGGKKAPKISMIFAGNPRAAAKTPSGCMVCMDSCYIGIAANSAYGLCVIDKGRPNLYARKDVLPADGTVVRVTFRIR